MDAAISQKVAVIIPAYRMHTQSFLQVLDSISEEDALKRVDGRTNHLVWMAGNYVNMRYGMAHVLGLPDTDPNQDLFFMGKALDENYHYPTLKELLANFHSISAKVYSRLLSVTDQELTDAFPMGMGIPFIQEDKLNFIGMCIGREDYLCGQMALMRRILNYESIRYDLIIDVEY